MTAMNLYACTMKGILAAKDRRRRRLLRAMAAAAVRRAGGSGVKIELLNVVSDEAALRHLRRSA